jgi:hypothetical protein
MLRDQQGPYERSKLLQQ